MIIALTGASGNMGGQALAQALELPFVTEARVLLSGKKKNDKFAKKLKRRYGKRIRIFRGDISDLGVCRMFADGADYLIHMAAVIPPASDASFHASYVSNQLGTETLVNAVKSLPQQPKFVHISTVALYGNRDWRHPWGRVGDPLLVSPYDSYAMHKLRGERYLLEAELDCWVVLRQTAMLHANMMKTNMSDGLMFHTCPNAPLEWVSARDSGYLIKLILERDAAKEVPQFWKKIYNIGAGRRGRETGFDTFGAGFRVIGGTTEKFFKPDWFATRNFHGLWFADGDELERLFGFQRQSPDDVWREIVKSHRIYALGKLVPAKLIYFFVFRRLLKHPNSPREWIRRGDAARVQAYFGGEAGVKALPKTWAETKLVAKGDFGDYDKLRDVEYARENGMLLSHGYDETKPQENWSLDEMKDAAKFRGGVCLEAEYGGDPYRKLRWRCGRGHEFSSSAYTVLRGGHWCPECCQPAPWDFNRLAAEIPFFAQVWYDTHDRSEEYAYALDENGNPALTKTEGGGNG